MSDSKLVCVGKITSAHGIKGAVKVKSYTEIPESLVGYSPLYNKTGSKVYEISLLSSNSDMLIVKIKGVTGRNEAEILRNQDLFAKKDLFPEVEEEEFYYDDLISMKVLTDKGEDFGEILAVSNYGGGDVLEVKVFSDGKKELFAFTKEIFPEILLEEGYVVINLPEVEHIQDCKNLED